jgi:hypothetical protein
VAEKSITTTPSGAKREDTYSFAPDWSGRLTKTVVKSAEAPANAHTIDVTTWEARSLFSGALVTYHPIVTKHHVCASGQTEATCLVPASAAGYSQTTSTLTPLATSRAGGSTTQLMYQQTSSLLQKGTAATNGDRRADTQYYLYADGTNYRLVTISDTKLHQVSGAFTTYGKTEYKWEDSALGDTSYRVPYSTAVWIDNNFANRIETARQYELTTGNLKKIWKPVQWAANQNRSTNLARTEYLYDARQLFAAQEVVSRGCFATSSCQTSWWRWISFSSTARGFSLTRNW